MDRDIIVIAHDLRSTHNVGSLLRTCEGLGVAQVYLTGYTPYPAVRPNADGASGPASDPRLPHLAAKLTAQIHKTALGAETMIPWSHLDDVAACIAQLRADEYAVVALEQAADSIPLPDFRPPQRIALLLGREVEGVAPEVLALCDRALEIPMSGRKESFNVVQAAAMALYQLRFG